MQGSVGNVLRPPHNTPVPGPADFLGTAHAHLRVTADQAGAVASPLQPLDHQGAGAADGAPPYAVVALAEGSR